YVSFVAQTRTPPKNARTPFIPLNVMYCIGVIQFDALSKPAIAMMKYATDELKPPTNKNHAKLFTFVHLGICQLAPMTSKPLTANITHQAQIGMALSSVSYSGKS